MRASSMFRTEIASHRVQQERGTLAAMHTQAAIARMKMEQVAMVIRHGVALPRRWRVTGSLPSATCTLAQQASTSQSPHRQ